jgi:DNA-binding transcriptional ArsR family regulator
MEEGLSIVFKALGHPIRRKILDLLKKSPRTTGELNEYFPEVSRYAIMKHFKEHHIGLMIFNLFLRKKGHEVIYLGPNTPFDGLTQLIKMKDLSVVAISLTNPGPLEDLEKWIENTLHTFPSLKFIMGGTCIKDCNRLDSRSVSYSIGMDCDEWYKSRSCMF